MNKEERFALACKKSGCPRDQIENFLRVGYVPQPKQLEFHAAARQADNPNGPVHIALGGDRGGSKSHAIMCQVALDDCQRFPGLDVLYLRKVGKAASKALAQLREKIFISIPHQFNRNSGIIRFKETGSTIVVGHFKDDKDIDQYVGIEFDLIVIEENTQLSKSKVDLLLGSLRTSKENWRPRSYRAANPGGIGHKDFRAQFVTPHRKGQEIDTRFIPASWRDNVFINPGYKKYLMGLTGVLGRMWRDGDWDVVAGQFFNNWNEELHVQEFQLPGGITYWCAMDYGLNHWNVVYLLAEMDGIVYVVDEYAMRFTLVPQHARNIKAMLANYYLTVPDLDCFVSGPDVFAKKGEAELSIAQQYEERGIILESAVTDRINGAAKLAQRLGSTEQAIPATIVIHPRCQRLIKCIPTLQHDPRRPEDVLKVDTDEDGNGGDDPYDALRYGLMQASQGVTQYGRNPMHGYRG